MFSLLQLVRKTGILVETTTTYNAKTARKRLVQFEGRAKQNVTHLLRNICFSKICYSARGVLKHSFFSRWNCTLLQTPFFFLLSLKHEAKYKATRKFADMRRCTRFLAHFETMLFGHGYCFAINLCVFWFVSLDPVAIFGILRLFYCCCLFSVVRAYSAVHSPRIYRMSQKKNPSEVSLKKIWISDENGIFRENGFLLRHPEERREGKMLFRCYRYPFAP